MNGPHFAYLFTNRWTLPLLAWFGSFEKCCYEYVPTHSFWGPAFFFLNSSDICFASKLAKNSTHIFKRWHSANELKQDYVALGCSVVPHTKRSQHWFPVRARAYVVGLVPIWGTCGRQLIAVSLLRQWSMYVCVSPSPLPLPLSLLPSLPKINKHYLGWGLKKNKKEP